MPDLDLPPEKVEELIDKIAHFIVDKEMEVPAIMFLETAKPLTYIASQFSLVFLWPYLSMIPENLGYNLVALFRDRKNVEKILQRIEELKEERDRLKKEKKAKKEKTKEKRKLRSLFGFLKRSKDN